MQGNTALAKLQGISITSYLENTPLAFQLVSAFAGGLVLAPWSWGFAFFLAFIVVFEIAAIVWGKKPPFGDAKGPGYPISRLGIMAAAVFGFVVGRTLIGDCDPTRPCF